MTNCWRKKKRHGRSREGPKKRVLICKREDQRKMDDHDWKGRDGAFPACGLSLTRAEQSGTGVGRAEKSLSKQGNKEKKKTVVRSIAEEHSPGLKPQ